MQSNRITTALLCAVAVLTLAACGGGGGSPAPEPPAPTTGDFVGVASNASGPLDEYVQLRFVPTSGGAARTINAGMSGQYAVSLTPGLYAVIVSRPGYQDNEQTGVEITAGADTPGDTLLVELPALTYIGSENCGVCHTSVYDAFTRSGHSYKLNKVEFAAAPTYPFTDISTVPARIADDGLDIPMGYTDTNGTLTDNALGTPSGWSQITYVIGGFYWKARFLDTDGYIVTGTEVQYNFKTDGMSAYHNNETDKTYNCGNCHTTGWKHWDETVNDARQDDLLGMDGTFAMPGVHCEACHGAGALHAQTMDDKDITEIATTRTLEDFQDGMFAYGKPVACGECHTRDGERDHPTFVSTAENNGWEGGAGWPKMGGRINAKGGLVRHHEQYDEVLGIDPDNIAGGSTRSDDFRQAHGDCLTCHSPHTSTVYRGTTGDPDGVNDSNLSCLGCHGEYDMSSLSSGMNEFNCIECHMPKMAKSATSELLASGVTVGDVSSHIFRIRLNTQNFDQFTDGGSFSYPHITGDWACRTCHGVDKFPVSDAMLDTYVFHTNVVPQKQK